MHMYGGRYRKSGGTHLIYGKKVWEKVNMDGKRLTLRV